MRRDSPALRAMTRVRSGTIFVTMLAAMLAAGALFGACGSDDDDERIADQNDAAATSAAAATEGAGATPDAGETPADATAEPDDGDPDETSVFDLREGDCITSTFGDETMLEEETGVVACDDPRAASEVLALVNVPDADEYPGEAYFDDQTATLCPEETDSFYFPTEESWGAGDRTIICLTSLE
ncbi:MAG TPA: hypothetical protein VNM91_07650 [Dehalococcoidia bacterium]|nr:hypothetical protein [Dehalococcoidia bacterium]